MSLEDLLAAREGMGSGGSMVVDAEAQRLMTEAQDALIAEQRRAAALDMAIRSFNGSVEVSPDAATILERAEQFIPYITDGETSVEATSVEEAVT